MRERQPDIGLIKLKQVVEFAEVGNGDYDYIINSDISVMLANQKYSYDMRCNWQVCKGSLIRRGSIVP